MDWQDDANPGHFILARSTGAHTAQDRGKVMAFLSIGLDDHQLTGTDFLDFRGSSSLHSTSRTGASKLRILTCAATFSAIVRNVRALGASGLAITIGCPISDCVRIARSRGTSPRNGMPSCSAARLPPPWPKMSSCELQ